MKRLLDDYIFDDQLRYEAHTLIYRPFDANEIQLTGIMGAAVLCALLADTDEGDERAIMLDDEEQRNSFFIRYEREVRRDNGGLFSTEVNALSQAYIEIANTEVLMHICRNDRLYDLAIGLVMDYMHRLVREQVYDHIYESVEWRMPFARWLFDAAFDETRRQYLLSFNWLDVAAVYTLSEQLSKAPSPLPPTFYFQGEDAEQLMEKYFYWLWQQVQAQTAMMPDAKVQLAELKPDLLEGETNWDFLQTELKQLEPEDLNLFRKWINQWTEFITRKLETPEKEAFPKPVKTPKFKQELFADTVLPCPSENNYVEVCDYIAERCRYDHPFAAYYHSRTRVQLCEQLTAIFGWYVDPNHLGKRINSHKRTKNR